MFTFSKLQQEAMALNDRLVNAGPDNLTGDNLSMNAAICVGEEAGELLGAFRRYAGLARRTGTFEEMESELADVIISAATFAECMNINIETAITKKLAVIWNRGFDNRK